MTTVAERAASTDATTFESRNPGTGDLVGVHAVHDAAHVEAAVARARTAAEWWGGLGHSARADRLRKLAGLMVRRSDELVDLVHRENGKPKFDAYLELTLSVEHLAWAARNASRVTRRRRVSSPVAVSNHAAHVEYVPLGVVGVIGPWNYPVFTPMGSIAYALAAGNAVVFKPSEFTPGVGEWLAAAVAEAIPEHAVLQVVTGFGDTGQALCRSGVDKLAFTGSAPTGRRVMATCAETLTPVLLELGGKDPLVVADDADVAGAAKAAVWGGLQNSGQACISIERVYVDDAVYDAFVDAVVAEASTLHASTDDDSPLGPITMPRQIDVIARHVDDALARGARAVVGGSESVGERFVDPVVLVDVPADALVLTEETFGPVLPIVRVSGTDEAVRLANSTGYGLGASVWSRHHGRDIARRLRAGMVAVNSVTTFAACPALPFGGVGESGFGRIHGADGLREFTRPKATTERRFPLPFDVMAFDRPAFLPGMIARMDKLRHGRH